MNQEFYSEHAGSIPVYYPYAIEAYLVKHLISNQKSCEFESRLSHYGGVKNTLVKHG